MHLSRWRALLRGGQWRVLSENGQEAPPQSRFDDHTRAQERADALNAEETRRMREHLQ